MHQRPPIDVCPSQLGSPHREDVANVVPVLTALRANRPAQLGDDCQAWRDDTLKPPALVVRVGTTVLSYRLECLDDLTAMLKAHGDWMGKLGLEHGARNNRGRTVPKKRGWTFHSVG